MTQRARIEPRLKILALLPVALVIATALAGCGVGEAGVTTETPEPAEVPVITALPTVGEAVALHNGTVNLEADSEAAVVAKVGGEVTQLLVEEGETVVAGQVLARLDHERLRLRMEQAQAALNKLKQEYRRNVALHERGLVSEGAFADLRYEMEALDAAYRLARLELDYSDIVAPIDGIVSARSVKVGNTVAAGEVTFRVTNTDALIAYLHVPQRDLAHYGVGMRARLSLAALPDERFEGTVSRISPRIDPVTGTFRVTLAVDGSTGDLRPGMFARVEVVYETRSNALLVPASAVLAEDEVRSIFVVEDGIARRRPVGLGLTSEDQIEVLEGLHGDERIIVVGQNAVSDGTPVAADHPGNRI